MRRALSKIVLGFLVAATGVGAGDLITASLAGSEIGLALLWAAVAGAGLKWVLNEGVARWQMATSGTLLQGWVRHLGAAAHWLFFAYFLVWSYIVGGALISACGVAGAGLLPLGDPRTSKILWGIAHSLVGLAIVRRGGFKAFERVMSGLTALMVAAVLLTVLMISPDWSGVIRGIAVPTIPARGTGWLLAVMGGVGGTVTLLCYSYWIREKGRKGKRGLRESRVDLTVAYGLTAFFGVSMIIIGSRLKIGGTGDTVALDLANQLGAVLGPAGRAIFLLGFWGAVFTSLLGVWQGVPYMFADFLRLKRGGEEKTAREASDLERTRWYKLYLFALALVPISLLWFRVKQIQFIYGLTGSLFMPFVALTLLILNNRKHLVGEEYKSGWLVNFLLAVTLVFFSCVGILQVVSLVR